MAMQTKIGGIGGFLDRPFASAEIFHP